MPNEIHGHDVIDLILESKQSYTRESLTSAIITRIGAATRFHTCSAAGLSAAELVTFLEDRGKFMPLDDGFTVDPARVCSH